MSPSARAVTRRLPTTFGSKRLLWVTVSVAVATLSATTPTSRRSNARTAFVSWLSWKPSSYTKRVFELVASRRYGRYLRRTKTGKLRINKAGVRKAEKHDGKFIVHSNDDTLTAEDLALGYKQLMRVEQSWRQLKSGLGMRPVFHWAPHRIHAHVFLTVLSLLLERVAEQACGDTWRNIRDDLKQIKLAQLSGPNGTLWQVTEPRTGARSRLKSLAIANPPAIVDHA